MNELFDLYIAGPMTGYEEFNFPAFNAAEKRLNDAGFTTRNPADHGAGTPGLVWADYMRRDIPDLLQCKHVAVLPGYQQSKGASLEVHIAKELGMQVHSVEFWISDAPLYFDKDNT